MALHLPAGLDSLTWLSGEWESAFSSFTVYESWHQAGDRLVGENHRVSQGDTTFSEGLTMIFADGRVIYRAEVADNPIPVDFKMVRSDSVNLVFENPDHDYPDRIIYRKVGSGSLYAFVEGKLPGEKRRLVFAGARRK